MTLNSKLLALGLGLVSANAAHASFTVGTFADPAGTSAQNFFRYTRLSSTTSFIEGAWLTDGLHLFTPGIPAPDQMNVRFEIRDASNQLGLDVSWNGVEYLSEAGYVRFFDSSNATVLRMDFDAALLGGTGLSAGFGSGTNVTMSGPLGDPSWTQEHFSFAFTNFNPISNSELTMSSAFTSSAVPEPISIATLGLGVVALIRRRRNKS